MIYGVGIDLVEIDRIETIVKKWGDNFLNKVFTTGEIEYCNGQAFPPRHFAVRFAAKEALLKAFGEGLFGGIGLREAEVYIGETGRPELRLHGRAGDLAAQEKIISANLSLSHSDKYATAVVILEIRSA
jgi:holo-[acyl-carrier protein] synthase